jgi:hypothetical protein
MCYSLRRPFIQIDEIEGNICSLSLEVGGSWRILPESSFTSAAIV